MLQKCNRLRDTTHFINEILEKIQKYLGLMKGIVEASEGLTR